jgi:hypothetical protein
LEAHAEEAGFDGTQIYISNMKQAQAHKKNDNKLEVFAEFKITDKAGSE